MTPNDVKIVAENIDDFIEVPDGVERLRKAVLTLAVSGKMVPQDKKEGTAEELLARIQSERKEAGLGKKVIKKSVPVSSEEIPFEIPKSWKWVRLSEVASIFNGNSINKNEKEIKFKGVKGIPYIATKDVGFDHVINYEPGVGIPKADWDDFKRAPKNSVFVCAEGGSAGRKVAHLGQDVFFGNKLFAIHPPSILDSKYIFYYCISSEFFDAFQSVMSGLIGGVSINKFGDLLLPLPPSGEQKRIIKKVEEMMKQLNELEIKKRERDEVRARLARSAMQALGKGESKIAFEQLTELIKTPSDIKELENALLTLTVSGKLVPQSKADGTAESLYNQIQKDRIKAEENSTARKKKTKHLDPITDDEALFGIPKSWRWVRIGEIGTVKGGKRLPKGSGFVEQVTGHPYIRITDMKNGSVNTSGVPYISDEVFDKISKYTIRSEDVYVTIAGTIGDAGKIPKELDGANLTENAAKIEFKFIDIDFLVLALRSIPVKAQFLEKVVQMAQPKLALHRIESSIIPLPPLSEQKRIVKKVEEVTGLINRLKKVMEI